MKSLCLIIFSFIWILIPKIGLPQITIIANAGSDVSICDQTSTTLKATGGDTYVWSSIPYGFTSSESNPTISPSVTTTYIVTVSQSGFSATDDVVITILPLPNADAGEDATACEGDHFSLLAKGGNHYDWSNGKNGAGNPIYWDTPGVFTYTVTVSNSYGCSKTDDVTITVIGKASVNAGPDVSYCPGLFATLNAAGADSYVWSNGSTASSIDVSPGTQTIYSVTGTTSGCSAIDEVVVSLFPAFSTSITVNPSRICNIQSADLTSINGVTWLWSTGEINSKINVNPLINTDYTVTTTDGNGCTASAAISISPNPIITINASPPVICNGESALLTCLGAESYVWSSGALTSSVSVAPKATTIYTVTATSSVCSQVLSILVNVNQLPNITVNNPTICYGSSANLIASGAMTYTWSGGISSAATTNVNPLTSTTYFVTGTDQNNCSATAMSKVTVPPEISLMSISANVSCKGGSDGSIALTVGGGISPYQYLWNTSPIQTGSTINNLRAGIYKVTVSDANNCFKTLTTTITEPPSLVAYIPSTSNVLCYGESTGAALASATGGTPDYTYFWNTDPPSFSPDISGLKAGNYVVTISDAKGCIAIGVASVNQPASALLASISSVTDVQCYGQANGEATVMAFYGTPGYSYTWNTVPAQYMATARNLTAGNYTVLVVDANNCSASISVNVNEPKKLVINSMNDTSICIGESISLLATGASSYQWFSNWSLINPNSIKPTTTTIYNVIGTDSDGCTAEDQLKITINPLPNANAGPDISICNQGVANLKATGGVSYLWSNGVLSASNPVILTSDQDYVVTVTDINSCENTDNVKVFVADELIVNIIPGLTKVCEKGNTTLTGDIAGNYQWNTGVSTPIMGNSQSIKVFPQTDTYYFLTVTNTMGCTASTNILLQVQPQLVLTLSPSVICYGQSSVITAGSNPLETYKWSNGASTPSIKVSPSSTTNYSVTVTSDACSASAATQLTVNALPFVDAGKDEIICNGIVANLFAEGSGDFVWSNTVASADNPVRVGITTMYKVTLTDSKGCRNSDSVFVFVNQPPEVDAGDDQTVCFGHSARLSAKGGESYVWSNGLKDSQIEVLSSQTTTYTVTVTDRNTCTNMDHVVVYVLPIPVANAGIDRTICAGASIAMSGSGGTTCNWSPEGTLSNPRSYSSYAHPLTTTIYTLKVSENGCTASDDMTIEVTPIPPADAGNPQAICAGDSVMLEASGGSVYLWSASTNTNLYNVNNPVVFPKLTTTYTVTVSDKGCFGIDHVLITVIPMPKAAISASETEICLGEKVLLVATGGTRYQWASSGNASIIVQPLYSQGYTVTAYNSFCSDIEEIYIKVNELPLPFFNVDNKAGCAPLTVQFHDNTLGAVGWNWYFGESKLVDATTEDPVIIFSESGKYKIRLVVTDSNGCSNELIVNDLIEVYPNPIADFYNLPEIATFTNSELIFYPERSSNFVESYYWHFEDPFSSDHFSSQKNPTHNYSELGLYPVTLFVETKNGCRDSIQKMIEFKDYTFYVPNAFSPDGDGINDYFGPKSIGLDLASFEMYIFDRWGQQVFHTNDIDVMWDGRVEGKTGESVLGVYTWLIINKLGNGKVEKLVGSVTILK